MVCHSKVLITGAEGFTGRYLREDFDAHGYECVALQSDLLDQKALSSEILRLCPDYVVHLAAISFTAESNASKIYDVNVIGSLNLLDALCPFRKSLECPESKFVNSGTCPGPTTHLLEQLRLRADRRQRREQPAVAERALRVGFGRVVAVYDRSSASYHIC